MLLKLILVLITASLWCSGYGQELPAIQTQGLPTENILSNPGFESGKFGWTVSAGSVSTETSVVFKGKNSLKIVLSNQTLNAFQDSTKYASQYADGPQGLGYVRVKTSVSGVKLCARKAGVIQSSLCVSSQGSGKWEHLKIPFILAGTSNGVSVLTDSAKTGTVYIDDSFVGAASLTQNMNACNDVSCETEFSASVTSAGVISNENLDWLSTCTFGTGYVCNFNPSIFTVAPNCTVTAADTTGGLGLLSSTTSSSVTPIFISRTDGGSTNVATPFKIICQKQGADFTAAKQLSNGNTYSSTNADTDWKDISNVSAGTFITSTGTSPTFGTVATNKAQWKRQGSDLLLKWDFRRTTIGTAGTGYYLINIPSETGCTIDTAKAPTTNPAGGATASAVSNSIVGTFYYLDSGNDGVGQLYPYSGTQLVASFIANPVSARYWWGQLNGGSMSVAAPQAISMEARVPCTGWENSNIIIGQFNGLESCSSTLDCTDTFSAKISSAGIVVAGSENVDWLDGNCGNPTTGTYNCTIKTGIFTAVPNCTATAEGGVGSPNTAMLNITSATALSAYLRNNSNGVQSSTWNLICQKQGVDYVGKTAKAVASDQNISTPGTIKSTLCSAKISATGVISDQKGGCFASCTNATTPVCTFTSNYWLSGQVPNCWGVQNVEAVAGLYTGRSGTTSTTFYSERVDSSDTARAGARTYFCHGERQ